MRLLSVVAGLALCLDIASCGGSAQHRVDVPAGGPSGEAPKRDVTCVGAPLPAEPDLTGWNASARASLARAGARGVVAVRYQAEGCDAKLEVLAGCSANGTYDDALGSDATLAGVHSLPGESTYTAADLRGPDCARATHIVSRIYMSRNGAADAVPQRLALIALDSRARIGCPEGSSWDGKSCIPDKLVIAAECPPRTRLDGDYCVGMTGSTSGARLTST